MKAKWTNLKQNSMGKKEILIPLLSYMTIHDNHAGSRGQILSPYLSTHIYILSSYIYKYTTMFDRLKNNLKHLQCYFNIANKNLFVAVLRHYHIKF
ncbi:hypothetical protein HanRHA438_Chr01g0035571 [Helianthus annuus]|nr:hypothetical protein HanRHA438_Chr01g0035571 [Helianthus annuus]